MHNFLVSILTFNITRRGNEVMSMLQCEDQIKAHPTHHSCH